MLLQFIHTIEEWGLQRVARVSCTVDIIDNDCKPRQLLQPLGLIVGLEEACFLLVQLVDEGP